ncbi:hypothetical protein [Tranquillimonas rosea]|uniref:hypothetical protein n=1 Tax=Tranquillimonas rosea TaxID=641238 RepID=UPI003BAA3E9D
MRFPTKSLLGGATIALLLQGCAAATPEQQRAREHEIACIGGTVTGALVGGAVGNAFGSGRGQDIFRAAGAGAGATAGARYSCG